MYGPRSCAWATDEEYLRLAEEAERGGYTPPPRRRAPPRPAHLPPNPTPDYYNRLYRGDSQVVPPIPRRPAPPSPTPDSEVARKVVDIVFGRIFASNIIVIENLPGPAAILILSHFVH